MRPDHLGAAGLHRGHIERRRDVPGILAGEDGPPRVVKDRVAVAFELRVVRRVEAVGDAFDELHRGVFGQFRVERVNQRLGRDVRRRFDAHDLPCRVDAGVGATGGVQANRLAGDLEPRPFQLPLHCSPPWLRLPAGELGAIVGQRNLEARQ